MSFNMFCSNFENQLVLAIPGEELPLLVATSPLLGGNQSGNLEIAGHGHSLADSMVIPGVSRGVSNVARDFQMIILLFIVDVVTWVRCRIDCIDS